MRALASEASGGIHGARATRATPADSSTPGRTEAWALALAGAAFAISLLALRDSTPVPSAAFDAAAAVLATWGFAPLVHRLTSAPLATLVRGGGAVLATVLLFKTLGENLDAATLPLALALAGAVVLQGDARRAARRGLAGVTVGSGLLLSGLGIGFAAADAFPEPQRLRFTIVLVAVLALLGLALRAVVLRTRHADLAPMPGGLVAGAVLLGIYAGYRPLAAQAVLNLPLYEWAIAVSVALLVFGRIRRVVREAQSPEAWSSDARRHAQDVRPLYDARMTPLAALVQRWVEHGDGLDEYRHALQRAHGAPLPDDARKALESARSQGTGVRMLPRSRREAAQARLAIHQKLLARLHEPVVTTTAAAAAAAATRGPPHGNPERRLHQDP